MITAIFKKSFHFVAWKKDPRGNMAAKQKLIVHASLQANPPNPGMTPQNVPDWVGETDLFKAGVEEKSILELKMITRAPLPPKPPAPPTPELAIEELGATGLQEAGKGKTKKT